MYSFQCSIIIFWALVEKNLLCTLFWRSYDQMKTRYWSNIYQLKALYVYLSLALSIKNFLASFLTLSLSPLLSVKVVSIQHFVTKFNLNLKLCKYFVMLYTIYCYALYFCQKLYFKKKKKLVLKFVLFGCCTLLP